MGKVMTGATPEKDAGTDVVRVLTPKEMQFAIQELVQNQRVLVDQVSALTKRVRELERRPVVPAGMKDGHVRQRKALVRYAETYQRGR